ncbi:MAG: M14-type cytosolic carboxypeptidase, partial [Pseudomonadota bacterium]
RLKVFAMAFMEDGYDVAHVFHHAGGAAYTDGWKDYRAVASYDRETWFRVDTDFDGTNLTLSHRPACDSVYYAYFAPYPMERHGDLIAQVQGSPILRVRVLGETLDGQDMDLLEIGTAGEGAKQCWVIARQHPGETMAEWWMEGFLERLLDEDDPVARELLARARFHVVPNMNPDGSRRGHLRTNAVGANLNREWLEPSLERSPEVFLVRGAMEQSGVDFCLDVHGDEGLPYNFIAGFEGIASWSEARQAMMEDYKAALMKASPDFQTTYGYGKAAPGKANLSMCTNYLAETFGCLAMTLEMPFKDTADSPNEAEGWSPERCRKLGAANLDALYGVIDRL